MKILILTKEYPPNIYGGAGVHVENLVRELAVLGQDDCTLEVLCFGSQLLKKSNLSVRGVDPEMQCATGALRHPELIKTLIRELSMIGIAEDTDIVHCHTWYTHLAGCLLKQLTGGRLVLTTHSLEPHRPWKMEQLGNAYRATSWMEKTAYENADGVIAVSRSMKEDVQRLYKVRADRTRVIHNGINTEEYRQRIDTEVLRRYGVDPDRCFILFVGRITRQKGIFHLIHALEYLQSATQIVLCAGAADTRELESEMSARVESARSRTLNPIVWIPKIVPKPDIISLYSAASVFVCPSIYEPFGIINLEAMACGTPVVGSAVGGIPEIIVHGETGFLVPFAAAGADNPEPADPDRYARDLASAIDALLQSPEKIKAMGLAARRRVESLFSWKSIARQTLDFYKQIS